MPNSTFLIGNTFPFSLIRRNVEIEVSNLSELRRLGQNSECCSFWGHLNTLKIANDLLDFDVSQLEERIAVKLNDDNYPILNGKVFTECWVLAPDYKKVFYPKIGKFLR
ncbi:MAG: hypothetical protein H8E71_04025 [Candidatus Marinimicrobia bacterium]|nr:hypothetical protein [Candidatus Neomarinimicrobiota bacterium]